MKVEDAGDIQAYIKMGFYGLQGSGKTFTALLIAEGLAALAKKQILFIDTETGTAFYGIDVKDRKVHPQKFVFKRATTKSIMEIISFLKTINTNEYGVVVIDSITHIWEACINAFSGELNRGGNVKFSAWSKIKKPYKELINILININAHVIICGRQGNEFENDEATGDIKKVGIKMKAEGETAYEPHIMIHMENIRNSDGSSTISAFAEKDRTGMLAGKTFTNPSFESLVLPIMELLGEKQAKIESADDTAKKDAEMLATEEAQSASESLDILRRTTAEMALAENLKDLEKIGDKIKKELRKKLSTDDLKTLRENYHERETALKGGKA